MILLHHPVDLPRLSSLKSTVVENVTPMHESNMEILLEEVQQLFEQHSRVDSLLALSKKLQAEFEERLQSSPQCMLPSHNYTLPNGMEHGTYLALEVGGSTLRVALVDLRGRNSSRHPLRIRRIVNSTIDNDVRDLRGVAFLDWIAEKIKDMLATDREATDHMQLKEPLPMGIAWSFPIELHLNIRLDAIVNDSSAAVLSRAYIDPSTRLAIILGTGMNAAIHLPISSLHSSKFGLRQLPSTLDTTHVLVNTELSMFGKRAFPTTRWDEYLNAQHMLPDFQPMEYLLAGGYLGEIVRLIILEATETANLFGGILPFKLSRPYSLETRALAAIEADTHPWLSPSRKLFHETYSLAQPPTPAEMRFIREVILSVSLRSRRYFTAAVYALSSLLHDLDRPNLQAVDHISIGCDGSVVNKYPGYMEKSQVLLDQLTRLEDGSGRARGRKRVVLESAGESAVLGAGVAVAMANAED
ncbi:MAG: hypothetical protein LQ341_006396 [Variospora aurantia]|nr:MAG: hypothetical protein LQ341_006396 [Variospora aurantia]